MNNEIQFILCHLPDEEGKVQVVIKDETIWATQKAMAQLFGDVKGQVSDISARNDGCKNCNCRDARVTGECYLVI